VSDQFPGGKSADTHWIGGWVDPRAGLDDLEKRRFLTLLGLELRPLSYPVRSLSLIPTALFTNIILFKLVWGGGGGVQVGPLSTAATNRPIVPTPGKYDNGEIGGMMIGRGNRSTRRKPVPVPLCLPQTPHATQTRTQAAAVGSQRLTA
jgi:hypothetical protein